MIVARAPASRPAGEPVPAPRSLRRLVWTALLAAVIGSLALVAEPALAHPAAPGAGEAADEPRPLRIGMRGSDVRALQRELRRRGVRLRPDAAFGRVTRAAVRCVQAALGLRVTGVADLTLLQRLGLAPAPVEEDPSTGTDAAATGAGEAPGRPDVVEVAWRFLGTPYRYGGDDPSGFEGLAPRLRLVPGALRGGGPSEPRTHDRRRAVAAGPPPPAAALGAASG